MRLLTLHTPLTDETRDLIGAQELALMKQGARIINCARGGLIDEAALAEALQVGPARRRGHRRLRPGAAAGGSSAAQGCRTWSCTPHLGASTEEAQISVAIEAAQLLVDFLTTGHGPVRRQHGRRSTGPSCEDLRLYLDLARRLGLLHAQMDRGAIRQGASCTTAARWPTRTPG